jgi:hypothetical protein
MTIDSKSLIFSKLSDDSDVSSFACSDSKDLEDFLRNDAKTRQHEKSVPPAMDIYYPWAPVADPP